MTEPPSGTPRAGAAESPDLPAPPVAITVTKGDPTAEELAALITVLATSTAADTATGTGTSGPAPRSDWAAYWRGLRAPMTPGSGAWRAAGR